VTLDFLRKTSKADFNARNCFGQTPLRVAHCNAVIRWCLQYGGLELLDAKDNRGRNFWHLLFFESKHGAHHLASPLKELVAERIFYHSIADRDAVGRTPLQYASLRGPELTECMINNIEEMKDCAFEQDYYGRTPFHYIAMNDSVLEIKSCQQQVNAKRKRNMNTKEDVFGITPREYNN
jgi:ankyrin repeat protein